jgi:outer membrane protein assembly factor BamB
MQVRHLSLSLAAVLLGLPAAAGDWTQFRGPGGGVSAEKDLPVKWGKDEGLLWKAALPGRGLSNPVIAAGRIYLTACSGFKERRLHVLCLDEVSGKKRWERQFTATGSTSCNPMTNMAAPTPATDGKSVYALFATGDLAALDRDGTLLWYRSLVGDYAGVTNQVGMAASPVLAGGTLLLPLENAGDSFAAGLDTKTGKNRWKVKRPRDINWVTPIVFTSGGQTAAVFMTSKDATAYDPATGNVLWTIQDGFSSIPSPAQGGGLLYLPGGGVRALKPGPPGSTPETAWRTNKFADGHPSPVYHAGRLYGLTKVAAVCLDARTGKEVWRARIDGPCAASPVVADGKLYAVSQKGRTTVLQLGDKPKVLARNDLDDTILATPAIANGRIYLRSDRWLYCVGSKK